MPIGLMGKKIGMTKVFIDSGEGIPVTVVEVLPHSVAQIKNEENDGYRALQLVAGKKRASKVTKAMAGHFAKAAVTAGALRESRLAKGEYADAKLGDVITVEVYKVGQYIDVRGLTRGKGFAGTIKRHHFAAQDATHGNSLSHRAAGSTGQNQSPGRVFKGKKMAGHLGDAYRSMTNLRVVKVDAARNLLYIKGSVPGAPGGELVIVSSVKRKGE